MTAFIAPRMARIAVYVYGGNSMTQENKQLLLQDLSARLPYGVMVLEDIDKEFDGGCVSKLVTITEIKGEKMFFTKSSFTPVTIEEIRPYLRSMSSMTEEEKEELSHLLPKNWSIEIDKLNNLYFDMCTTVFLEIDSILNILNWLLSRHFDFQGLIEKELALEALEGMYK